MQLTKKCPRYTYCKDGVYYFSKVVPKDLSDPYRKPRIAKCLGTRLPQSTWVLAGRMLGRLLVFWSEERAFMQKRGSGSGKSIVVLGPKTFRLD